MAILSLKPFPPVLCFPNYIGPIEKNRDRRMENRWKSIGTMLKSSIATPWASVKFYSKPASEWLSNCVRITEASNKVNTVFRIIGCWQGRCLPAESFFHSWKILKWRIKHCLPQGYSVRMCFCRWACWYDRAAYSAKSYRSQSLQAWVLHDEQAGSILHPQLALDNDK